MEGKEKNEKEIFKFINYNNYFSNIISNAKTIQIYLL